MLWLSLFKYKIEKILKYNVSDKYMEKFKSSFQRLKKFYESYSR